MRQDKRKKLEEAGWKVGNASEFLGLPQEEAEYIDLRIRLGLLLRDELPSLSPSHGNLLRRILTPS